MWRHVLSLVGSAVVALSSAQLPVPPKPPGFTYGNGAAGASVQLETYIDLLCPDSKSAYPGLKKLAEHYKPEEFRLRFVPFPLPYHQHAFAAAEAAFTITDALGDDHFIPWLETMYENQDMFWNKPTKDKTPMEVTKMLEKLAMHTFPKLTKDHWVRGMTGYGGTDADSETRVAWKYTCARGMSGTPMYTLNGVPYSAADATWTFDDWKQVIDPMVKANKPKEVSLEASMTQNNAAVYAGDVPHPDRQVVQLAARSGTFNAAKVCAHLNGEGRPCEYIPGRAMCCQSHEACILRSGCIALD